MKKILVQITDDTDTSMVEPLTIKHLSDLGDGVKEVVDDFVKLNGGVVMPPVSIEAVELKDTGTTGGD